MPAALLPIQSEPGVTFYLGLSAKFPNGLPMDISAYEPELHIFETPKYLGAAHTILLLTDADNFPNQDLENGQFDISIGATDTATVPEGAYKYTLTLRNPLDEDDVIRLLQGSYTSQQGSFVGMSVVQVFLDGTQAGVGPELPLPTGAAAEDTLQDVRDGTARATVPTISTVTLSAVDTQYPVVIPDHTRSLTFRARTDVDIRYNFIEGEVVANSYFTLKAGETFNERDLDLVSKILYLATGNGGTIVEVEAWST